MINKIIYKINNIFNKKKSLSYIDSFAYLKPGDIAIDCGANVGSITTRMADKGAIVYAFEPNPYAFAILNNKFRNNKQVNCINKGVFNKKGKMKLYLHKNADKDQAKWSVGSSLLSGKSNIDKNKYIDVELVDLAEFIQKINKEIAVLKIDVEGVECPIINKLIDTNIIKQIKRILVETHDKKMPELKTETDKLRHRIKQEKIKNINLNWI